MALAVLGLVLAAGCRTRPAADGLAGAGPDVTDGAAARPRPAPPPERVTDPFGSSASLEETDLSGSGMDRGADAAWAEGMLEVVYFEFDRSGLTEQARAALDRNAEFLRANPGLRTRIEGHCDERGTVEYNLALGDRRAHSAKEYLVQRGIAADRLTTVSFGEEQPADPGHDEAAYARNRRAEFRVQ
jgi:peptidoglycan-associated lipoprotein